MTRTKRVLDAARICYESDHGEGAYQRSEWVYESLPEVERAFERFLLVLDEPTFESLLASRQSQRSATA